jgi:hypothetical protein
MCLRWDRTFIWVENPTSAAVAGADAGCAVTETLNDRIFAQTYSKTATDGQSTKKTPRHAQYRWTHLIRSDLIHIRVEIKHLGTDGKHVTTKNQPSHTELKRDRHSHCAASGKNDIYHRLIILWCRTRYRSSATLARWVPSAHNRPAVHKIERM